MHPNHTTPVKGGLCHTAAGPVPAPPGRSAASAGPGSPDLSGTGTRRIHYREARRAMVRTRTRIVWVMAVTAAVVAQAGPQGVCRGCDRSPECLGGAACHGGPVAPEAGAEPVAGCPLCPATTDRRCDGADAPPCHCQLNARQDRPLAPSPGASPAPVAADSQAAWSAAPPTAPPTLGVSREYAADLLAVPIRPPRILFGVWRN